MTDTAQRTKVLISGILSLILCMGIARFSYTPIMPIMQQQAGLGLDSGGWLAAINYIGYIIGAIVAASLSDLVLKDKLYRLGLVVAILSTVLMGISDSFWVWAVSRFFAGLATAAGLLIGSGLVMHWLIQHEFKSELGIHFSGVGLGIAFGSAWVLLLEPYLQWQMHWVYLTVIGIFLAIPAWLWLPRPNVEQQTISGQAMVDKPPSALFLRLFMLAYFCAGVGYVVSATFIVAIIKHSSEIALNGAWAFLIIGLAAAPACISWDILARKMGVFNALLLAYVLNTLAIALSSISNDTLPMLISSALFGFTFIGIVSLVLTVAGRYYPTRPAKMMGKMTVSYGVAQILAPAVTGWLAASSGDYHAGLIIALVAMMAGSVLMIKLRAMHALGD